MFELFGTGLLSLWTTSSSFSRYNIFLVLYAHQGVLALWAKICALYGIARNDESAGLLLIRINE